MKLQPALLIALAIPVLGLLALVIKAELRASATETWEVAIRGYDPRDLLRGQYLRYRFDFERGGQDECGPSAEHSDASVRGRVQPEELSDECCLCLQRSAPGALGAQVRQVECDGADERCEDVLQVQSIRSPLRYFIPEDRASELERALGERAASLVLRVDPAGAPADQQLLLDGEPWREAL